MTRQPPESRNPTTGFTAVVCHICSNDAELPVLQALRETIRRCPHGILLSAGCLLGQLWCHSGRNRTPRLAGPIVLVQPCTTTRQPVGPAIPVGPLRTAQDLAVLGSWLEQAPHDHNGLPARLREIRRHQPNATHN